MKTPIKSHKPSDVLFSTLEWWDWWRIGKSAFIHMVLRLDIPGAWVDFFVTTAMQTFTPRSAPISSIRRPSQSQTSKPTSSLTSTVATLRLMRDDIRVVCVKDHTACEPSGMTADMYSSCLSRHQAAFSLSTTLKRNTQV
jgi:hypothetical protein